MALELKVPSMVCEGCVEIVTKAIKTVDSDAGVNVDLETKTVSVESQVSEESIKQAIVATGHTIG
jgi:copper chaperone